MVEHIEFGKRFSALLLLEVSVFVALVPGGFLWERTLHPRARLSDNRKARTLHRRGSGVSDGLHCGELSRDSAREPDRPERLSDVWRTSVGRASRHPRWQGMANRP